MNPFVLQVVCTNGCAFMLLITLLLNYKRKHGSKTDESRLYVRMITSNLLQCVVETASSIIDGKMFFGAIPLATALNAFLFMNTICFSLSWALYAEAKIYSHRQKKHVWSYLKYLPAVLIMCGSVLNLFVPVFFRITEENVYQRIGLYPVSYLMTYFYLALGTITIFLHREAKEKSMFMPAFTFLFPVIVASAVQFMVPGISLLWSGAAIGLASAYMSLQDESAFTDKLSGLFSRHYLNHFLRTLEERSREARYLLGIMMDVDDFKSINDRYGHLMGDDAIAAVGGILKSAIPEKGFIFRYAGDEFVIIMPIEELSEINPVFERISDETERFNKTGNKPYRLSLSVGYSTYVPGENPNTFIERMDTKMYQYKRQHKAIETKELQPYEAERSLRR